MEKIRFLQCLSKQYPTIDSAATEIINLQSILNLPKGTEHFLSDIHGEYESFSHVLRNGSGAVRRRLMMYSGIHSVQMTRVSLRHLFTIQKKK